MDEEKRKAIKDACERYLEGEPLREIANDLGIHYGWLIRVLKKGLGDKLIIKFNGKKTNIRDEVTIEIPRLVSKDLEEGVRRKIARNRTIDKAPIKYKYLLKSLIKCSVCGKTMVGCKPHSLRYYNPQSSSL